MKLMRINKVPFYYALYKGRERIPGTITPKIIYEKPAAFKANISAATGDAYVQPFGADLSYDKLILLNRKTAPAIDEYTVLWVDTLPVINPDGTTDTPHDYIVRKVAVSLNAVLIAISKVTVSG